MTKLHDYEINVSDTVYDMNGKEIEVTNISISKSYPISAAGNAYTEKGMFYEGDRYPSLFWQPIEITDKQLKKAMTKPKKMVTKYRAIYSVLSNDDEYYLDEKDYYEKYPGRNLICLVKKLSKEFEE